MVPLSKIPDGLQHATIAAEDANFYEHPGFDVIAILRALYLNIRGREIVSGASTITQQLVKNTLLTPEQTPDRKIKEAILAYEVEPPLQQGPHPRAVPERGLLREPLVRCRSGSADLLWALRQRP